VERKRNNLDTAEANFIYSRVLIETNKLKNFSNLFITERNKIIDKICVQVISSENKSSNDVEALKFEVLSYKLNNQEKEKFYSSNNYEKDLIEPENFNDILSNKYDSAINIFIDDIIL